MLSSRICGIKGGGFLFAWILFLQTGKKIFVVKAIKDKRNNENDSLKNDLFFKCYNGNACIDLYPTVKFIYPLKNCFTGLRNCFAWWRSKNLFLKLLLFCMNLFELIFNSLPLFFTKSKKACQNEVCKNSWSFKWKTVS